MCQKDNLLDNYNTDKKTTHILNSHIYGFIKTLKKSEKLSQKTMYLNIKYVEVFDRYLFYYKPDLLLRDINESVVEEYKIFCLNSLKNNNKTVNKKLGTLVKFFKYLTNYKKIFTYNFMLNVPKLKNEEEKKPTIFKTSELLLLFDTMRKYMYGYRDIIISKIILETGMLTKDILELHVNQISLENNTLTVQEESPKKESIKHVYNLSGNLMQDIVQYYNLRDTLNINNSTFLFLSIKGTKYSIRSYQMFFEEAIRRCNLSSTYSPRHLRSTFLYQMSKLVSEERLKLITSQDKVKQYYELSLNPLRNLI